MELVNLGDVSQPVMNRDNDIGESVIQIWVVKVYYASPTVDRHTGRGGVERQPCAVPIHVSVKSHPEVPSAARNQEAETRLRAIIDHRPYHHPADLNVWVLQRINPPATRAHAVGADDGKPNRTPSAWMISSSSLHPTDPTRLGDDYLDLSPVRRVGHFSKALVG